VAAMLEKAFGYQGDKMNLPVPDLDKALPFYETVLGFRVTSREEAPHKSAVLARDGLEMRLFAEFKANGLQKDLSEFDTEHHGGVAWKVFYVVAPDGLCYWFGERQG
jgi:lactoylglutathione lyase